MEKDKFLFVVSGAAGTGKDSVVKALREAHPEIEKTVSGKALEHVIEKADPGIDLAYSAPVQFQTKRNVCLLGLSHIICCSAHTNSRSFPTLQLLLYYGFHEKGITFVQNFPQTGHGLNWRVP